VRHVAALSGSEFESVFNKTGACFGRQKKIREVLDCGSPLPLLEIIGARKRQQTAAVQNAGAQYSQAKFAAATEFLNPL
jgi:hypothetical protein